jgi:hypothetical protein
MEKMGVVRDKREIESIMTQKLVEIFGLYLRPFP